LKEMFASSWALDRGKGQIDEHINKAKEIFEEIPMINQEAKLSFAHMMRKMENK
jgi:hypothetical protein